MGIESELEPTLEPSQLVITLDKDFLVPKSRVLFLGCGSGADALYLARQGYEVVVVDPHKKPLEELEGIAKREDLNILTYDQSYKAFAKNLHSNVFDAILALNSFNDLKTEDCITIVNHMRGCKCFNIIEMDTEHSAVPSAGPEARGLPPNMLRSMYTDSLLCYEEREIPTKTTFRGIEATHHYVLIVADTEKNPQQVKAV